MPEEDRLKENRSTDAALPGNEPAEVPTVLVVNIDDTESRRSRRSRILRQAGYEVVELASLDMTQALALPREPSLILLNLHSSMDGAAACRRLRDRNPAAMILQISPSPPSADMVVGGQPSEPEFGADSTADGYLVQPVDPSELIASVRTLLRLKAAEEELRTKAPAGYQIEERQRGEAGLTQRKKMDALARLSGGIAHDFNNILGAISGSLQFIRKRVREGNYDIDRYVESAIESVERASRLTGRLQVFSQREAAHLRDLDLHGLIQEALASIKHLMGEKIALELVLNARSCWIRGDRDRLQTALLNMAANARDAMPDGGILRIETGEEILPRPQLPALMHLAPGRYVTLACCDTGSGMSPSVLERATEPFFTTRRPGKAAGLGLSMIYGLMSQSGGGMVLESEEGLGTVIKLYLVAAEEQRLPDENKMEQVPALGKKQATILIAEDEELIRMMMVEVLQDEHFEVLDAGNGEAALQHLAANKNVDLLIADVGLPGLNGRQLAEKARAANPAIKAIFVTGYSRDIIQDQAAHGGMEDWIKSIAVLRKPFDLTELIDKVRSILADG